MIIILERSFFYKLFFFFVIEKEIFFSIISSYCWPFSGAVISFYWADELDECEQWAHYIGTQRHLFLCVYYASFPSEKSSEDFPIFLFARIETGFWTQLHIHKSMHKHTHTHMLVVILTNIIVSFITHISRNNRIVAILLSSYHLSHYFERRGERTAFKTKGVQSSKEK